MKTPQQVEWWGGTAGVAFDPCYHAACDTIANLNAHALALNADAVAYAMYLYASGREAINQTDRTAGPSALPYAAAYGSA